jgi:peroxiredoxin
MHKLHKLLAALLLFLCVLASSSYAQDKKPTHSPQVTAIFERLKTLRSLSNAERAKVTRQLALEIRQLPAEPDKLSAALGLSGLSTEGDFGAETLQEVATTLAQALHEQPQPAKDGHPAMPYTELASLVRYEHVTAALDDPQFAAALAALEAEDREREQLDFTLTDLQGKAWTLRELRGKVVLVNFWATWCPPCRKEIPDLDALSKEFGPKGLVILGISDETSDRIDLFLKRQEINYPVLLDAESAVHKQFHVEGIPKSFLYGRDGKLAAVAIDMRTRGQFLRMLESAGMK